MSALYRGHPQEFLDRLDWLRHFVGLDAKQASTELEATLPALERRCHRHKHRAHAAWFHAAHMEEKDTRR